MFYVFLTRKIDWFDYFFSILVFEFIFAIGDFSGVLSIINLELPKKVVVKFDSILFGLWMSSYICSTWVVSLLPRFIRLL